VLHPGYWKPPWPHRESFINFYKSGGVQNDDILSPTLYDFCKEHGLSTYVIHQFYNRSLTQAANWSEVYDGDIHNIDDSWGRATFQDVRDMKLPDPDANRLMDRRGFAKAAYLRDNGLPSVFTMYASSIDLDSHKFRDHGFNSVVAAQVAGLRFVDEEITRFVTELQQQHPEIYEKTLFFVIADHGHTENDPTRKIDLGTLRFPGEAEPGDLFRVKENGYMVHLYIKVNDVWTDIPTTAQIDAFMNDTLPFATYQQGGRLLADNIDLFVTRDRRVFRNWNGTSWEVFPLSDLDDSEYGFVDGRRRIGRLLHTFRAGDVVMIRGRSDLDETKNVGFTGSQSTHGSLFPEDSLIPFYVWGEPLNVKRGAEGSVRIKEADIVDLTATVLSWLRIYQPHSGQIDGKPLFDEELNINLDDFEIVEERRLDALEILFGRRVG
jgi:hypothetical protein